MSKNFVLPLALVLVTSAILVTGVVVFQPKEQSPYTHIVGGDSAGTEVNEKNLLILINAQRLAQEMRPLKDDSSLVLAAAQQSHCLVQSNGIGGEQLRGVCTGVSFAREAHYDGSVQEDDAGLNSNVTAQDIVRTLMANDVAKGHILDPQVSDFGFGISGNQSVLLYGAKQ